MSDETAKAEVVVTERPPIEILEKVVAGMLDGEGIGAPDWRWTLRDFRKALAAARRENVWDLLDLAFGTVAEVGVEMLIRSQIAMRLRMEALTQRHGAERFPDVREDAERVERVATFLLDSAAKFAKIRHVSSIVRRQGDPKIVDFGAAREKASREEVEAGDVEKKTGAAEA